MTETTPEEETEVVENYILNPVEVDKLDEETGEVVLDDDGNPEREVVSANPVTLWPEVGPVVGGEETPEPEPEPEPEDSF